MTRRMLGRRRILTIFAAAAVTLACSSASMAAEEGASKEIAARVEIYPISTLTLSDRQFLQGDSNDAKATTVSGELRVAQGTGRLPVVVLVHGSGGVGANVDMWSKDFNRMGISTFVLDGFTGRGLTTVSGNQALLGRLNLILDVYRVLDILAKHPRVDPARIALMGFSRGGQATLYASLKRFQKMWNRSGVEFAAYVPFYPDCMTTFVSDTDVADRPIRIFQGTADDYNPVAACKAYVGRLRAAGHDVELTEYPNAPHSFDNPLGRIPPALAKNSQTVRHCVIREEPLGQLTNAQTHAAFTYEDPCVERGPHIGHNPEATQAARKAVADFLRTTLRLE